MPLKIVRDNIVHMKVDAIVNAANSALRQGGGVCGAIFAAAGADAMQRACDAIGGCPTGGAVITDGFRLPAKHVIHAVGPVWYGGDHGERALLFSCYTSALELAAERNLSSVAFPLISSGIYGYPKDQALSVAVDAIGAFLMRHDMDVYLVVFDRAAYQLSSKLFESVASYIDEHYVDARMRRDRRFRLNRNAEFVCGAPMLAPCEAPMPKRRAASLEDAMAHLTDTFSQSVLRLIDQRGEKDADVYKRANLDRKLFSKLRGDIHYQPSKSTAVALAIALKLNLDETRDLLARAGYALSPAQRGDVIVSYFIERQNYNIFEINEVLFAFDEACL